MDADDPEQRIADLERQLAEQKRGAGPSPANPDQLAASGRFTAFPAPPGTMQMYKFMYGSLAGFAVLIFVIGPASMALYLKLGPTIGTTAGVFALGLLVICGLVLFWRFPRFFGRDDRRKEIVICVTSDGLTVDQRPGEVFPFSGAHLGPWILGGMFSLGTALHLQNGPHRFVLGGRDHRMATGTRLDAPPADTVDAWMWTSGFAVLLTMVGRRSGLDVRGPAPEDPTHCLLFPNPSRSIAYSGFGMFNNAQQLANPPQAGLAIDVGKDAIWVIDPNRNGLKASAWLTQVTAIPAENTIDAHRAGTYTTPVMVVRLPGLAPLTIGCADSPDPGSARISYSPGRYGGVFRFSWRGQVQPVDHPEYLVSGADWLTLVEKFGMAPQLDDIATR